MKTAIPSHFNFINARTFTFRRTLMSKPRQVPFHARPVLRPAMLAALSAIFISPLALAFSSGSTGADGALAPTVNTQITLPPSGILNYTSVTIPVGVTVTFKKNALNTPVQMLVSGDVTIRGVLTVRGGDAKHSGTYGDGNQADDGIPGTGGPGGFDGGRGGRDDPALRAEIVRAGSGLGPGGGRGGTEGDDGCTGTTYFKYLGSGASFATGVRNLGEYYFDAYCSPSTIGRAKPYGSSLLQPLIGGSGGGGGRGGTAFPGSGGGGGGGALLIAASGVINIVTGGQIEAIGGDGGGQSGPGVGGQGAGGSGGGVRLIATTLTGAGPIYANGGCINSNNTARQSCDTNSQSGGSNGRVRLEGENITYTGTATPAYSVDTPGPIFLSSLPSLRIASVAGSAVPANPTGTADVTLPANIVNPVTVSFETANVPQGNTVLLKVIPAYGIAIEAITPAITGTTAAGTASVQVTLPQGPSVLQATTTYTVVVAMGEALSRFAQNERVEKVQLIATLGGESQAKLITISGKEFVVPASVLQMVGFAG